MSVEQNVVLNLSVKGASQASKAMQDVADKTKQAGSAADQAQKKLSGFNPTEAARAAMTRDSQAFATRQARLAIDPAFAATERQRVADALRKQQEEEAKAEADARKKAADRARSNRTRAIGSAAASFAIVGGGFQQAAAAVDQIQSTDSFGKAVGRVSLAFAEGIPLVGTFVRGMHEWIKSTRESTQILKADKEFNARQAQRSAAFQAGLVAEEAGRQELAERRRGVGAAGLAAGEGRAMLAALRDPATRAAISDERSGDQALAVLRARGSLGSAETIAQQGLGEAAAAAARVREAQAGVAAARGSIQGAESRLQGLVAAGATDDDKAIMKEQIATQRMLLQEKLKQEELAIADAKKAQERSEQSLLGSAQQKLNLSKAEVELAKVKLQIATEERDRVKSGAASFGLSNPMEQRALLDAQRKFRKDGIEALTPEELARLQGSSITAPGIEKAAIARAQADPTFRDLLKETGTKDLATLEAEVRNLKIQTTFKLEFDEAEYRRQTEVIAREVFDRMGVIVRQEVDNIKAQQQNQVALGQPRS